MSKKNEYYLSPQDFFRGVVTAKIEGRVTDELGRMFLLLAKKTAMHRYWIRYSHIKDDIESESLYACMKAFNGFKPFQKSYASEHGEWDEKTMIEYDYNIHYNPHA